MKVEWFGHSCFKLTESTGTSVVTDPYGAEVGYKLPKLTADIITCSHNHFDHNNFSIVQGEPKIIDKVCVLEHDGVSIKSINSYHDDKSGQLRGKNLIFKYRIDGIDVCHMGDIGEKCHASLVEMLMPVNVLLIPIGGFYTIDAEEAKEYVDKIMPDIVIPMHYRTRTHNSQEIDKKDAFVKLFNEENIDCVDEDYLMLDRNDFSHESTRLVIMKRQK